MKTLSEYSNVPLRLVSTSFLALDYDLFAGEELIASFSCGRTFSFNGSLTGFGKNIEFYKESVWSGDTCIREMGKENPFARYKRETGFYTGLVTLPKGNRIRIKFGFFYKTVTIEKENGNTLVLLKRPNIFSRKINVAIQEIPESLNENPWIIFLALYISIKGMMRRF